MLLENRRSRRAGAMLVLCGIMCGCSLFYYKDFRLSAHHEVVLEDGDTLSARTKNGTLVIVGGSQTTRSYKWGEGCVWTLKLLARFVPHEGRFGIYWGGDSRLPEHEGLYRIVTEECYAHYISVHEAMADLNGPWWSGYLGAVWTHDGLVVGMGKSRERRQLNVDVRQILIKGKKPLRLPGAQDDRVEFSRRPKA